MSLEDKLDLLTAEQKRTNALLTQLVEATAGDLVRIEEAVQRLDMSRPTIQRRIREGVIKVWRDGRTPRVSISQIQESMRDGN